MATSRLDIILQDVLVTYIISDVITIVYEYARERTLEEVVGIILDHYFSPGMQCPRNLMSEHHHGCGQIVYEADDGRSSGGGNVTHNVVVRTGDDGWMVITRDAVTYRCYSLVKVLQHLAHLSYTRGNSASAILYPMSKHTHYCHRARLYATADCHGCPKAIDLTDPTAASDPAFHAYLLFRAYRLLSGYRCVGYPLTEYEERLGRTWMEKHEVVSVTTHESRKRRRCELY